MIMSRYKTGAEKLSSLRDSLMLMMLKCLHCGTSRSVDKTAAAESTLLRSASSNFAMQFSDHVPGKVKGCYGDRQKRC